MMDWSDRHCRYLWRLISQHSRLYTEMVTTGALLHREPARFLDYNPEEHPLALQLGGSDAGDLARCAILAEQWGYYEVNLNCGCPSDRVQNGMIGACLMAHPEKVADAYQAMQDKVDIEVTIKHRIGIDDMDDYEGMVNFIRPIAARGCQTFIVHARKAWLKGLSPKENREVPPLEYAFVHRLKQEFPELTIVINGGIKTLDDTLMHLTKVDGVMVGREAYSNPYLLAEVDQHVFGDSHPIPSRTAIAEQYIDYCVKQMDKGSRLNHLSRHILGLYQGEPGARAFRRHISENAHRDNATVDVLVDALRYIA
ncbi:tRNA-dihydrouridine synthase A [gamma proteobacterium IMCC1989]|nr:tRNA-dihydrouridine synthase A [gamma proteobacterium IMCC1989]